jgi:prepilin-type N-terminal cleavage/methylation domain-containing protein
MNLIKRKILTAHKQKGFSLLELILVLGISSLAFIGFLAYEKRQTEALRDAAAGQQMVELGQALSSYITREQSVITANLATNAQATLPITVLQGTASGAYPGVSLLPTTYTTTGVFGTGYSLLIKKNASGNIVGLVLTAAPVKDPAGNVRYDWMGTAMQNMGAQSGMTTNFGTGNANTLQGYNAGWSLTNTDFTQISQLGLLGYRVQYQGNLDDVYLRLDGTYPMIGNLNMGNYNIQNATDVSYNGWLYGNNALVNNIKSGYIYNTGNITNTGDVQTFTAHGSGSGNYATFDTLIANGPNGNVWAQGYASTGGYGNVLAHNIDHYTQSGGLTGTLILNGIGNGNVQIGNGNTGNLYVKDIYLQQGSGYAGRAINSWLSDRLPRYSLRSVQFVGQGSVVGMPNCGGAAGGAKILIIPQQSWIQSKVEGTLYMGELAGDAGIYVYQDQYTIGSMMVWATNNGNNTWTTNIQTTAYNGGYNYGYGLAETYCDYVD